ncbi:hypothetical protein LCGC14_1099760 [marine sediment metagenome]|uniref:Uncharacterized protein n=1 Tax=marine sediment metagenome TaxID=412755 RepID=A0A0F9MED4_9ZZZZ
MSTALTTRKLTKGQIQQLSTYTDPGTILAVLKKKGWTIEKAVDKLVDIIDDTDTKVSTQLAAIKYLNQMVIDSMERSGLMVMASKTVRGEDGEEITFTGHMVSSNLQGPSSAQTTIEDLKGEDYPDKEQEDVQEKPKKTGKGKRKSKKPNRGGGKGTAGERPESDDGAGGTTEAGLSGTKTKNRGNAGDNSRHEEGGGGNIQGRTTEAGLSDDLHTSKYPEIHLDAFKGLAVPPESRVTGPADSTKDYF